MNYDVAMIGLGYVGLTLATALADVGFEVVGVEKRPDVVNMTNAGVPHFSEVGLEEMLVDVTRRGAFTATTELPPESACSIYIITVGTPLNSVGTARLDFIEAATRSVAEHMQDGALVILRSTVKIGTARNVVAPILEKSGKSFQLAMCPERTLEGRAMKELRKLPQVIGADDSATRQRAEQFFHRLTSSTVQVNSLEAAEIIKLVDNTYRDVQFGFANEVARICDAAGVNASEVIDSGKLGYARTNVAQPGLVGGPCLEKDPHILAQSCRDLGIELDITVAARQVNERQPKETVTFILGEYARRKPGKSPTVSVLGLAFKGVPATDDLRGTMALKVISALTDLAPDAKVRLYDPVCSADQLVDFFPGAVIANSLEDCITNTDIVIITNNHPKLGEMRPKTMAGFLNDDGFIYDYWGHFSNLRQQELGNFYFAVGNTALSNEGAERGA